MIKQLVEAGNSPSKTPEVRLSFESGFLDEGLTELKGVLLDMDVESAAEYFDDFVHNESKAATVLRTVVSMKIVLTSVNVSRERIEELTGKEMSQFLQRALEF